MRILKALVSASIAAVVLLCSSSSANAQRMALKTNALEYLILTPNIAVETRLNPVLSMQLSVSCNPINKAIAGYSLAHYRVEPELRYWFNRPMARHFVAVSFSAVSCNLRFDDHYFKGDAFAAGVSYGYALVLSEHWNMETEVGIGLATVRGFDYYGKDNRPATKNYSKILPVPMRLALSFSYIF